MPRLQRNIFILALFLPLMGAANLNAQRNWHNPVTTVRQQPDRKVEHVFNSSYPDPKGMPLFLRAGAIVPMGPDVEHTAEKPADPIELRVCRGADGHPVYRQTTDHPERFQKLNREDHEEMELFSLWSLWPS
jgi:hypothetical protein